MAIDGGAGAATLRPTFNAAFTSVLCAFYALLLPSSVGSVQKSVAVAEFHQVAAGMIAGPCAIAYVNCSPNSIVIFSHSFKDRIDKSRVFGET